MSQPRETMGIASPGAAGQPATFEVLLGQVVASAVRAAVVDALGELRQPEAAPALLDRAGLAHELAISTRTLDLLRAEPGFPELRVADSPRFELAPVLSWIRARTNERKSP